MIITIITMMTLTMTVLAMMAMITMTSDDGYDYDDYDDDGNFCCEGSISGSFLKPFKEQSKFSKGFFRTQQSHLTAWCQ